MNDTPHPPVQLPDVDPPTDQEWHDAREALSLHATHRAGCPKKDSEHASCTCSAGRWTEAIQV